MLGRAVGTCSPPPQRLFCGDRPLRRSSRFTSQADRLVACNLSGLGDLYGLKRPMAWDMEDSDGRGRPD